MKQKMLKRLKYEEVKDRLWVDHTKKRAILWKTNKKEQVEMIIDTSKLETLIQMIIF